MSLTKVSVSSRSCLWPLNKTPLALSWMKSTLLCPFRTLMTFHNCPELFPALSSTACQHCLPISFRPGLDISSGLSCESFLLFQSIWLHWEMTSWPLTPAYTHQPVSDLSLLWNPCVLRGRLHLFSVVTSHVIVHILVVISILCILQFNFFDFKRMEIAYPFSRYSLISRMQSTVSSVFRTHPWSLLGFLQQSLHCSCSIPGCLPHESLQIIPKIHSWLCHGLF